MEAFVTHIITSGELKRLGYMSLKEEKDTPLWMNVALVTSFLVYIVIAVINPLFSCYALPFVIAFSIPNIVDFVGENKKHWIYFIVGVLFFCSLFLMKYTDIILYPMLIILVVSPLIIANFFRVLYTNSIKYSNNGQNKIE